MAFQAPPETLTVRAGRIPISSRPSMTPIWKEHRAEPPDRASPTRRAEPSRSRAGGDADSGVIRARRTSSTPYPSADSASARRAIQKFSRLWSAEGGKKEGAAPTPEAPPPKIHAARAGMGGDWLGCRLSPVRNERRRDGALVSEDRVQGEDYDEHYGGMPPWTAGAMLRVGAGSGRQVGGSIRPGGGRSRSRCRAGRAPNRPSRPAPTLRQSMMGVVAVLVERLVDAELADPQPATRDLLGAVGVDVLDVVGLSLDVQDDDVEGEGGRRRRAEPVDVVLLVRDRGVAADAGDLVDRGLDDHVGIGLFDLVVLLQLELALEDVVAGGHVLVAVGDDGPVLLHPEDLAHEDDVLRDAVEAGELDHPGAHAQVRILEVGAQLVEVNGGQQLRQLDPVVELLDLCLPHRGTDAAGLQVPAHVVEVPHLVVGDGPDRRRERVAGEERLEQRVGGDGAEE